MTDAIISLLRRRNRGHQNRIWSSSRYFEMKTSTSHVNKLRARRQLLDLSHGPVTDILFPITLLWASFLSLSLPTREEAKSDWFMESCGRLSWLNFLFFLGLIYSTQSFSVFDLLFVPLEYSLPSAAPPFWITTYMKSRVFDLMTETCSWNNSDEIRSDFRGLSSQLNEQGLDLSLTASILLNFKNSYKGSCHLTFSNSVFEIESSLVH